MATTLTFPYGAFPVDASFKACYTRDYSEARRYPLPEYLPHHHPLLRHLEGTYSLAYTVPPWWPSCVEQIKPDLLKPLLASLLPQEFRLGCIEQSRWKRFRETLSERERSLVPPSPKLGILVGNTDWCYRFVDRGSATTPDQLTLTISTRPLDFLYMSNGKDWTSCQHFREGEQNERLPGNFYDTNVAIATVRSPEAEAQDDASILARTTIRLFHHETRDVVGIGWVYHNNETVALLLLQKLAEIFDTQRVAWGFLTGVNALSSCRNGSLGPELAARAFEASETRLTGEPCWFPYEWELPYIDRGDNDWNSNDWHGSNGYSQCQLTANLCLLPPSPTSLLDKPTSFASLPSRLAPAGMLPLFL